MSAVLHFVYDPLCGWCYCAEPLVDVAREVEGLTISMHGGGLWPEPTRLPEETRRYIRQADARAAEISGQPYGTAYLDSLLPDPTMTLESRPTTAAVLAAETLLAHGGLDMLKAIQHAHYERGLRVVEPQVLAQLAAEIGIEPEAFTAALDAIDVDGHIANSRRFMQQIGAGGFPAFALETGMQWLAVPNQQFASNPAGFADWLIAALDKESKLGRG
jgi:putative protein-disulfide isomerase